MKNSELAKSYLPSTILCFVFIIQCIPHRPTPSDVNKDLISFLNYVSKKFLSNASYDNIKNFVLHNPFCFFISIYSILYEYAPDTLQYLEKCSDCLTGITW